MRTLGLIGGMSWESTALYYRIINMQVKEALGGLHSAPLLIYSFDFAPIADLQKAGRWDEATQRMIEVAHSLKTTGAQALVICSNTMHAMADDVKRATEIPLLHVADATAQAVRARGLSRIGLLGTRFTMEQPFYRRRLEELGVSAIVPPTEDRAETHRVIYEELCQGVINFHSLTSLRGIIDRLKKAGAQGVVLGCTELCLLLGSDECAGLPLFDTTAIHARAAADFALTGVRAEITEPAA